MKKRERERERDRRRKRTETKRIVLWKKNKDKSFALSRRNPVLFTIFNWRGVSFFCVCVCVCAYWQMFWFAWEISNATVGLWLGKAAFTFWHNQYIYDDLELNWKLQELLTVSVQSVRQTNKQNKVWIAVIQPKIQIIK